MRATAYSWTRRPLDEAIVGMSEPVTGCLFGIARHDPELDAVVQPLAVSGPQGRRTIECVLRRRDLEAIAGGPAADPLAAFRRIEAAVHRCFLAKLARAQFDESAFPRLRLVVAATEVGHAGPVKPAATPASDPHVTARVADEPAPWRKAVPANWRYLRALGAVAD